MKRRISDLLDNIQEDQIDLRQPTPLSSERIKELTMGHIQQKDHSQKKSRRTGFRILAAAAVIALLPVTVFAAEQIFGAGDWFRGRMNEQLKQDQQFVEENDLNVTVQETVSQGQVDVANALGQNFQEQTVTSNGTTMTMTAAYGDAHVLHVYLQVEAPEGTVLPDGILYKFHDWNSDECDPLTVGENAPYSEIYGQITDIIPLADSDPSDNKKEFDIVLYNGYTPDFMLEQGLTGNGARFNDGVSKLLNLTGIYQQVVDVNGDEDGYIPFATGDFTFDIGLINEAEVLDIDVKGKNYGGHAVRKWSHPENPDQHFELCPPYDENNVHTEEWDYTVTPRVLRISPLTVQCENTYTCTDERMGCGLKFKIVMKDGTSPMTRGMGGYGGDGISSDLRMFTTLIDLTQIDYIEIGDPEVGETYKIDMN